MRKQLRRLRAEKRAAAKPANVATLTPISGGRKRQVVQDALIRAKAKHPNDRQARANVFKPYEPPPGVVPAGHAMAMDSAAMQSQINWASQSLGVYWQEGLTFLGYAYLSELTLRPEYRIISQVIATEMTRKWIKIQAVGENEEPAPETTPQEQRAKEEKRQEFTARMAAIEKGGGQPPFGGNGAADAELKDDDEQQRPGQEEDKDDAASPSAALAGEGNEEDTEGKAQFGEQREEEQPFPDGEEGKPGEEGELDGDLEAAAKKLDEKSERIKELEDELDRLNVRDIFYKLAEMDGWMGRVHLYIDTGATDNPDELKTDLGDGRNEVTKAKFKQGSLERLAVIEPVWTYPQNYNSNDPLKKEWYNPSHWFVMGKQLHTSRLLTFVGRPVPDILKPAYAFGGLSMSQIAKPYIDNWLNTRQSVNDIIRAFSVMVVSTDMMARLQSSDEDLFDRIDLFNALRDNRGTFVIDKETEDFKNVSAPLSSLDQLQAQAQEHMASVSRIPLVKLLGISPHGLNASSEGELKAFYDTIASFQEFFFRPHLTKIIHFAMMNLWGEVDEEITFKFEDLWALDEKEQAEVEKIRAETGDILINGSNAITPAEERKRVANTAETPYEGLDVNNVPEPPPMPEEGNLNLQGHKPFGGGETGESEGQNAKEALGLGEEEPVPEDKPEAEGKEDKSFFGEDAQWNESDHPRIKSGEGGGQFTSGGGGGSSKRAGLENRSKFGSSSKSPNQLKSIISSNEERMEDVNEESMHNEDMSEAENERLMREYAALDAINYVAKNDLIAKNNPELAKNSRFEYLGDDFEGTTAAIHYTIDGDTSEIKWLGSLGGGEGTKLMKQAIAEATLAGAKKVVVTAKWNSEAFYKKLGFVATGKHNPLNDSIAMELKLPGQAHDAGKG